MVSAFLRLLIFLPVILIPAFDSSSLAFCMMFSAYKLNKQGDNIHPWSILSQFRTMSSSNCCFSSYIQVSQETGNVVWYSHLIKNIPQFVVICIAKDFSIVHKAEIDDFLKFLSFSMTHCMLAIWSLVPLPFLNPACTSEVLRSHASEAYHEGIWA